MSSNNWLSFISKYAKDNNIKYNKALKAQHAKELYKYQYVHCVMCNEKKNRDNMFTPRVCLNKYGNAKAHKICSDCWFDEKNGFALEGSQHQCPGCVHHLPMNTYPPKKKKATKNEPAPEIIELLDD
jgi:hypothetical protein